MGWDIKWDMFKARLLRPFPYRKHNKMSRSPFEVIQTRKSLKGEKKITLGDSQNKTVSKQNSFVPGALQRNFLPQTILFSNLLSRGVAISSPNTPKRCLGHLVLPVTLAAYLSHIPLCRVLAFSAFHYSPVPHTQFVQNLHIPTHTSPQPSREE